jgi:hypothetical protein
MADLIGRNVFKEFHKVDIIIFLLIIGGYPQTPILLLSLAQRKKQRDIHPNQAFPYMGRM